MTCPMCPAILPSPLPGICPKCGVGLPRDLEGDHARHSTPSLDPILRRLLRDRT